MGVMNKGTGEMFDLGFRTSRPRSHRVLMSLTWDEPEMMFYSLVHSRHDTPSCGSLHFASSSSGSSPTLNPKAVQPKPKALLPKLQTN